MASGGSGGGGGGGKGGAAKSNPAHTEGLLGLDVNHSPLASPH